MHNAFFQSLRNLNHRKDRATMIAYGVIMVTGLCLSFVPFSSQAQRLAMSKFHLKTRPFELWAVLQPVPSMYNFGNEIWVSRDPLTWERIEQGKLGPNVYHRWVNHYPLRILSFGEQRKNFPQGVYFIYLRSRYGKQVMASEFRLTVDNGRLILEVVS